MISDPLFLCTGPELFYFEVLECGRRILLTGVVIFITPNSTTQVAAACFFSFGTLLGFELLRPHQDPADLWLYRLVNRYNILPLLTMVEPNSGMEIGAECTSPLRN